MEKIRVEIRAAEGGDDSKLLVDDMANLYVKVAKRSGFTVGSSTH